MSQDAEILKKTELPAEYSSCNTAGKTDSFSGSQLLCMELCLCYNESGYYLWSTSSVFLCD